MVTIGIEQLLINSALYEHKCLEILISYINILVNMTINRSIRSSPKGLITTVQCMLAHKSLNKTPEILNDKQKTSVRILDTSETKQKAIRTGNMLWYSITNQRGSTKTNKQVKQAI